MSRFLAPLAFVASLGCYQSHERGIDAAPRVDAAVAPDADAGRLCGCPGSPSRHVCVLPLMCCPATETCENPAHFSCSGSNPCR